MSSMYVPSGRFSAIGILLFLLSILTIHPLLGVVYAYAIWYCPFIYLNLVTMLFIALLGVLVVNNQIVKFGKIRNGSLAAWLSGLAAHSFLWVHWAVWVDLALNATEGKKIALSSVSSIAVSNARIDQVLQLLLSPALLGRLILEIDKTGAWSILGFNVSGIPLMLIWIGEALAIVCVSAFAVYQVQKPFCETSDKWFEEKTLTTVFPFIESESEFVEALEQGDYSKITAMEPIGGGARSHSTLTLFTSKGSEECFLTIANKIAKLDKYGKVSFSSGDVCTARRIDGATRRHLEALQSGS